MHKNSKVTPACRREIYELWKRGENITSLSKKFRVTRRIIYTILKRARLKDFSIHKSMNNRFKKVLYGLKHLSKVEKIALGKLARQARRYEKEYPGEMVHFDSKKLPRVKGDNQKLKKESLFVAIDDYSRHLFADIMPDKTQESAAIFLATAIATVPYKIECAYSDNGTEFKGTLQHDFVWVCNDNGIEQKFTRVATPRTNGKAERVIRTIVEQWLAKDIFPSREERRKSLQQFVKFYNEKRPHFALKIEGQKITPCQLLQNFVNSKLYTTL